jgi:hypothetical protein
MRAEYAAWHHALVLLARDLAGKLKEYDVLPPTCAAEPWRTGETDRGAVLDGAPSGSLAKRPLGPARKVAGHRWNQRSNGKLGLMAKPVCGGAAGPRGKKSQKIDGKTLSSVIDPP